MKKKLTQSPKTILLITLSLLLLIALLSACEWQSLVGAWQGEGANTVQNPVGDTTTTENTAVLSTTVVPPILSTTVPPATTAAPPPVTTVPPKKVFHPLTALPTFLQGAFNRPLGFCVARASASLIKEAEIVIEAPTEGSDTRLSLIGTDISALFPSLEIASSRPYLAAVTHDFYAISVYRGTNDMNLPSTALLYDKVDLVELPIAQEEGTLLSAITTAGYSAQLAGERITLPYLFAEEGIVKRYDSATPSSYIAIPFSDNATTNFTYDAVQNSYTLRSSAAMTADGALPTFSNLVVLFHSSTRHVTKDGIVLSLNTDEGGEGYLLTAGGAIPILWKRDAATSALCFTDTENRPLTLNRGKTYLAMTAYDRKNEVVLN